MRVGCDVQSIAELRAKPALLGNRAVFSRYEREYCEGRRDPWASLAGILCAKEACFKTLFGFDEPPSLTYLDVEIRHGENGRPRLQPGERLRVWLAANALTVDLTISHSGDYAMATALAVHH
ncbi:MAG: 4'-phosphopantetheinyl transferase superfamily protein [Kofleriaceae bacterium]